MFPTWFRYLVGLALVALIGATASVAWGMEDFPYGQPINTKVLIAKTAATYQVYTPPSSSSITYVYGWYSTNASGIDCGATPLWRSGAGQYFQLYLKCVGTTLKWTPVGGSSYDAMLVYSSVSYQAPVTSVDVDVVASNTFSPNNNVDVDVIASNTFSPTNNITSSGSFTIGSASFSLDTTALESAVDSLKYPWLLALPFFLFLYALFSVISAIRKK